MPSRKRIDWPVVATALAAQLSHTKLHPAAMLRALAEHRRAQRRGGRSSRWAVAFSGGADSLALLLIFWAEGPGRWGRDFVVLHYNHRLRGRASAADARFCQGLCRSLGLRCVVGTWRKAHKGAGEAEARTARHAFFAREMKQRGCRLLWLAHQQDDIAESMLMRLARGSGTAGLAAPRPVQATGDGRLHLRPMLTLKKAQIVAALGKAGAEWREDASNAGQNFFRNRVRLRVVPAWHKAAARDAIGGAALARALLEEDDTALEAWLDRLAPLKRGMLDLHVLADAPRAVARRALHRWFLAVRPQTDLSRQGFELLLEAVIRGTATRFSLGRSGFAVIRNGKLAFRKV